MNNNYHRIFLVSNSPRRFQILSNAKVRFSVFENEIDENIDCDKIEDLTLKLSNIKAKSACNKLLNLYKNGDFTIISADTAVGISGKILGKPKSKDDAKNMLQMLSGQTHSVCTGVRILNIKSGKIEDEISFCEKSDVSFLELSDNDIEEYILTGEPMDKAGAYAIQGLGATFVSKINGNYHNVVGLPISRLLLELKNLNVIDNSHKYKAAIFDLDGTILDTLHSLAYCSNKTLEELGKKPIDVDKYKYFAGDGALKLVERVLEYSNLPLNDYLDIAKSTYMKFFKENMDYKVRVYEGLYSILEKLKSMGVKIAVFTNKPDKIAKSVLFKMFGEDFFDGIQGDNDGIHLKPNPYAILNWSKKWNIDTKDILYLGDTNTDMKTGLAAGAFTLGVSWGFRKRDELFENGAYDVIDKPYQILNYV